MLGALQQIVLAIVIWAIAACTASAAWFGPCATARLIASWKHDGLWRTTAIADQKHGGHQVRYVGELHAGSRIYRIYFDVNDDPSMEAPRGHQDVIVAAANGKFLGLYDIDSTQPIRTEGTDILFKWNKQDGDDRIHFGSKGPPDRVHVGGDLFDFSTPADYRKYAPNEKPWPPRGPRVSDYCRR